MSTVRLRRCDMAIVYRSTLASGGGGAAEGTAVQADVRSGKTFSNSTASGLPGTMANITGSTHTLDSSTTSYTIPEGYHDGTGKVNVSTEEKTASSASYNSNTVVNASSGKLMTKATVPPLTHTETYQATSRSSSLNMGVNHNYRYVDTTGVPGIVPSGNKALSYTTNGNNTGIDVTDYSTVSVNVQVPQGITPSGNRALSYTSNGSRTGIDVSSYATVSVDVQVPQGVTPSGTKNLGTFSSNGSQSPSTDVSSYKYVSFTISVPASSCSHSGTKDFGWELVPAGGGTVTLDMGQYHGERYARVEISVEEEITIDG
jgi:hypothetical protein